MVLYTYIGKRRLNDKKLSKTFVKNDLEQNKDFDEYLYLDFKTSFIIGEILDMTKNEKNYYSVTKTNTYNNNQEKIREWHLKEQSEKVIHKDRKDRLILSKSDISKMTIQELMDFCHKNRISFRNILMYAFERYW